jgi:ubiquinone/menaquinone biosynthesis C-methylase UbiE
MSLNNRLKQVQLDFYENYYPQLSLKGKVGSYHKFTHKFLETLILADESFPVTIEIGAGSGEHFQFVKHKFEKFYQTDIRPDEKMPQDARILKIVCDATEIPLPTESCDRVIVTCLLHHLDDPMLALLEFRRLIKVGGVISILIPSDPGILYRFLRVISSERRLRKLGFEHSKLLHAVEHRNHVQSLIEQVNFIFVNDKVLIKSWPIKLRKIWNFNLLFAFRIEKLAEN